MRLYYLFCDASFRFCFTSSYFSGLVSFKFLYQLFARSLFFTTSSGFCFFRAHLCFILSAISSLCSSYYCFIFALPLSLSLYLRPHSLLRVFLTSGGCCRGKLLLIAFVSFNIYSRSFSYKIQRCCFLIVSS